MALARWSPTPFDLVEVVRSVARMIFGQGAEPLDDPVDDRLGQAGDAGQQAVALGLHRGVEVGGAVGEVQHVGHGLEVEQRLGVEAGQAGHGLLEVPVVLLVEVVDDDQAALVLHPGQELLELEAHEAAVDAELDDVALDLLGDAQHHLGALQHHDDVADGDEVLDLERREAVGDLVEALLVALEGLQGLVGPVEQPGDGLRAGASRRPRRRR